MLQMHKTLRSLVAQRGSLEKLMRLAPCVGPAAWSNDLSSKHLREIQDFGSNPGGLRMFAYLPAPASAGCPLVVVLHGCTQTAASSAHGAGWSTLAQACVVCL